VVYRGSEVGLHRLDLYVAQTIRERALRRGALVLARRWPGTWLDSELCQAHTRNQTCHCLRLANPLISWILGFLSSPSPTDSVGEPQVQTPAFDKRYAGKVEIQSHVLSMSPGKGP